MDPRNADANGNFRNPESQKPLGSALYRNGSLLRDMPLLVWRLLPSLGTVSPKLSAWLKGC